jgi:hypothetical protein
MTRGELLARMPSRELTDWMVYAAVEPFGEERADYRAALVASVIANVNRDANKHPQPFPVEDFLLFRDREPLSPDEVAAKLARVLGAPD